MVPPPYVRESALLCVTLKGSKLLLLLRQLALLSADDRNWAIQNFPPLGSVVLLEQLRTSAVDFMSFYACASYVFLQEVKTVLV